MHKNMTKDEWLSTHTCQTDMTMVDYYLANSTDNFKGQSKYFLACALEYALYSFNEHTDFYTTIIDRFKGILSESDIMEYLEGRSDDNRFASANNMEYTAEEWIEMYVK